ncbi:MAG: VOC family protein [Acidimicrobiales bacterium]
MAGLSHIDLTVRDADASAKWYQDVLGLEEVFRADMGERLAITVAQRSTHLVLGLLQHKNAKSGLFDETRTGLDHLAFMVADREALEAWVEHLTSKGIECSEIKDVSIGATFQFRDPDNIQLEFWANKQQQPA